MTVTQIDLDDDALAEVMRLAGTKTKKETVNLALQEFVDRRKRAEAMQKAIEHARNWDYEGWKKQREQDRSIA